MKDGFEGRLSRICFGTSYEKELTFDFVQVVLIPTHL